MTAVDSASMAQAFFITTPVGASPRWELERQDSKASWAFAAAATSAGDSTTVVNSAALAAIMQAPAPISKRSISTLSLGDNQELDPATPRFTRYISEDIEGLLCPTLNVSANEGTSNNWGLEGIREDPEEAGSPTNVDDQSMGLNRNKSGDFMIPPELFRNRSDELPFGLARARSENFSGLGHILGHQAAISVVIATEQVPAAHNEVVKQEAKEGESDSEEDSAAESSDGERKQAAALLANVRRISTRNAGKPKRKIVDTDDEESDEEYVPGGKAPSRSCAKRAKKSHGSSGGSHNNRGAHVKGRPEMQETARRGQEHWARQVQELREQWREERCWEADSAFQGQLELLARRHIKSQHECLLRCLHIATSRGMVKPAHYNNAEGKSFLGWTGFSVVPNRAGEFREMVEAMFPSPLLENTLHNTFRRAGLVPGSWGEAWLGLSPFMYKKQNTGH